MMTVREHKCHVVEEAGYVSNMHMVVDTYTQLMHMVLTQTRFTKHDTRVRRGVARQARRRSSRGILLFSLDRLEKFPL